MVVLCIYSFAFPTQLHHLLLHHFHCIIFPCTAGWNRRCALKVVWSVGTKQGLRKAFVVHIFIHQVAGGGGQGAAKQAYNVGVLHTGNQLHLLYKFLIVLPEFWRQLLYCHFHTIMQDTLQPQQLGLQDVNFQRRVHMGSIIAIVQVQQSTALALYMAPNTPSPILFLRWKFLVATFRSSYSKTLLGGWCTLNSSEGNEASIRFLELQSTEKEPTLKNTAINYNSPLHSTIGELYTIIATRTEDECTCQVSHQCVSCHWPVEANKGLEWGLWRSVCFHFWHKAHTHPISPNMTKNVVTGTTIFQIVLLLCIGWAGDGASAAVKKWPQHT